MNGRSWLRKFAKFSVGREMDVRIVTFPETPVAAVSHLGSPETEHDTVQKLVAWKLENQLLNKEKFRHYGLHHSDSRLENSESHRVDFCISYDGEIPDNSIGIEKMIIPELRCAHARDIGSRRNNAAAAYMYEMWLPDSGEELSGHPIIFHYVNVGPDVTDEEAITDVYMPLK